MSASLPALAAGLATVALVGAFTAVSAPAALATLETRSAVRARASSPFSMKRKRQIGAGVGLAVG
ncbi:MAG: hypothetical protein ACRDMH_12705, partial [Solirubrobacterales bacterium]